MSTTCYIIDVDDNKVIDHAGSWSAADKLAHKHFMLDGREAKVLTGNEVSRQKLHNPFEHELTGHDNE